MGKDGSKHTHTHTPKLLPVALLLMGTDCFHHQSTTGITTQSTYLYKQLVDIAVSENKTLFSASSFDTGYTYLPSFPNTNTGKAGTSVLGPQVDHGGHRC